MSNRINRPKYPAITAISNIHDEMAAFDQLPPVIRRMLSESPLDFSAVSILSRMRNKGLTADRVANITVRSIELAKEVLRAQIVEACGR